MSLLDVTSEKCVMLDKTTADDPTGGFNTTWVDGATFEASIDLDNSIAAMTAQAQGVTGIYTVITKKNINLQFHDVFRRVSDGKIFRVTTDGDDDKTPETAHLNMREVHAEEWTLPRV